MTRKSQPELPPESPIAFHPCSNGEMPPRPRDRRDDRAESMYARIVEDKSRRIGMTRRGFCESASGMAAAIFVVNQVYGCAGGGSGAVSGPGDGGGDGFSRDGGFDVERDVSARDAAAAGQDALYPIERDALEDQAQADALLSGDEFIFDVQTHNRVPRPPWNAATCNDPAAMVCPTTWIREIFVASDTDVACLSGFPAPRSDDAPSIQTRKAIKEIVDRLTGSPRLLIHANVRPNGGTAELDAMERDAQSFPVAAWKSYPQDGSLDDVAGAALIARVRKTGIKVIAAHRGIGSDGGAWTGQWSPRDVVAAAKANPDIAFLVYHSGWQSASGYDEEHPFPDGNSAPRSIDRLIKAVRDAGMAPNTGNVYAELGSTWYNLMRTPAQAAHALGKLLKYLGPDRVLWGTDSVNNGNAVGQIAMFRAFQIPATLQQMFGYPALTPEVRRKIFGLNAARVYGVDAAAVRRTITNDDVGMIKLARREDPRAFPFAEHRPRGPRTWREYLDFRRWSGESG